RLQRREWKNLGGAANKAALPRFFPLPAAAYRDDQASSGRSRTISTSIAQVRNITALAWPFQTADCHMLNHSPPTKTNPTKYNWKTSVRPQAATAFASTNARRSSRARNSL